MGSPSAKPSKNENAATQANKYFLEFANISQIQGLYFIITSLCRLEQIMWAILVAVCIGLTIRDICLTVSAYVNEDTTAEINIVPTNMSIAFHFPEIRLRMNGLAHPDMLATVENSSSVRALLHSFRNRSLDEMFQPISFDTIRGVKYANDTVRLWRLTMHMLTNIQFRQSTDITYSGFMYGQLYPMGPLQKAAYEFYRNKMNVSMSEVLEVCGLMLCRMMVMRSDISWYDTEKIVSEFELCRRGHIVRLNTQSANHVLDFRIRPKYKVRIQSTERLSIDIYSNYLEKFLAAEFRDSDVGDTRDWLATFRFAGPNGDDAASDVTVHMNNFYEIESRVDSHFMQLSTNSRACGRDTREACRTRCFGELLRDNCGCVLPTFTNYVANTTKQCLDYLLDAGALEAETNVVTNQSFKDYWENCTSKASTNDSRDLCESRCNVDACETWTYSFAPVPKLTDSSSYKVTVVRFTTHQTTYPEFTERISMNRQDFFSQLGGVLGLYIGASFLALYHFVVFVIRICLDLCQGKHYSCLTRKKPRSKPPPANISNGGTEMKKRPVVMMKEQGRTISIADIAQASRKAKLLKASAKLRRLSKLSERLEHDPPIAEVAEKQCEMCSDLESLKRAWKNEQDKSTKLTSQVAEMQSSLEIVMKQLGAGTANKATTEPDTKVAKTCNGSCIRDRVVFAEINGTSD